MHKSSILSLIAVLFICLSAQSIAKSAADYYEEAIIRFDSGEYKSAGLLLKNALRDDPSHLPSRILLGKSLLHLGDIAGAEKDLKIALEYGADESQVITLIGAAYLVLGKYEQLLTEIRSGGRSDDVEMQILVLRAYAHLQLGKLEQSKKNLRRARRLQPHNAGPMLALATVAIREGAFDEAERLINLAKQHNPDPAEIHFAFGELARLRGDHALAIDLFNKAVEIQPGKHTARLSRAALLMIQGEDALAKKDIDFVQKSSPNNLQAIYLNALLLARSGNYKEASSQLQGISQTLSGLTTQFLNSHGPTMLLLGTLDYLQNKLESAKSRLRRYVRLEPNHLQPRLLLADTLIKLKDDMGATIVLKPMLELHPENVDLLILAGTAYMNTRQYTEASRYLDQAANLNPKNQRVRTHLALSNLGLGNIEEAKTNLSEVVESGENQFGPGILLANIQLRDKEYDAALDTLQKLREKQPNNPLSMNLSGLAWLGKGELERAKSAFESALEIDASFIPARLNLAAVEAGMKSYEASGNHYQKVLRQQPENIQAMEGLAKISDQQNLVHNTINWLEKIRNVETVSTPLPVLNRLAQLYLETERAEQALEIANEISQQAPGELAELEIRGRAHLLLGEHEKASRFLRIMHQSNPDSAEILQRTGALLMQAGDYKSATKAIEQALTMKPNLLTARGTKVVLYQRMGELEKAISEAEKIQQDFPQQSLGYRLIGNINMQRGNHAEAATAYAAGMAITPDTQLLLLQVRAESAVGNHAEAKGILNRWLRLHPRDVKAHRLLATIYSREGALELAHKHYTALTELQPSNAKLFNNLAAISQRMGLADAVVLAEHAYQLDPNDAAVNDTLGWILVNRKEYAKGLDHLRQSQARATGKAEVSYHLAVALNGLGRTDEAKRELATALSKGKKFQGFNDAIELLRQLEQIN